MVTKENYLQAREVFIKKDAPVYECSAYASIKELVHSTREKKPPGFNSFNTTFLPVLTLAGESSSDCQWLVVTKCESGGAWVTYPIVITNWYKIQYTSDNQGKTINTQQQGGVIKNASIPGFFPFSQQISGAWVKRYKDYSFYTDYEFSFDNSRCDLRS